jgi:hypothetical protein
MAAPTPQFRRGTIGQKAVETEQPSTPTTPSTPAVRPNKFAAPCVTCGVRVPEGEGRLEKNNGKWEVSHIPPCPEPGQQAEQAPAQVQHKQTVVNGQTLYDGIYTVEDAGSGHRTFRLRTQATDDDFMPGVQIIAVLTGPDNDTDYLNFGTVTPTGTLRVWKKQAGRQTIVDDAEGFLRDPHRESVLKSVNCYRCGRTLSVPTSVHNGLGPECSKKGF